MAVIFIYGLSRAVLPLVRTAPRRISFLQLNFTPNGVNLITRFCIELCYKGDVIYGARNALLRVQKNKAINKQARNMENGRRITSYIFLIATLAKNVACSSLSHPARKWYATDIASPEIYSFNECRIGKFRDLRKIRLKETFLTLIALNSAAIESYHSLLGDFLASSARSSTKATKCLDKGERCNWMGTTAYKSLEGDSFQINKALEAQFYSIF